MTARFINPPPGRGLYLEDRDGIEGILLEPLIFESEELGFAVAVPVGFATDFASIPRFLWALIPKRGKHDKAAILHDGGYRGKLLTIKGEPLHLTKTQTDHLFIEVMEVSGVNVVTRQLMFRAVVIFGGSSYVDKRQPIAPSLKDAIAAHLAQIPDGKRGALVVVADEQGTRAHLAARINGNWNVAFEAGKPWHGPVTGQVMVQGTW